jgi:hypothetical protein
VLRGKWIESAELRRTVTPWAGVQMVAVAMLLVDGTGDEGFFRFLQRALPSLCIGSRVGVGVPILETTHKQVPQ